MGQAPIAHKTNAFSVANGERTIEPQSKILPPGPEPALGFIRMGPLENPCKER